jgi:heptosyltransferase I
MKIVIIKLSSLGDIVQAMVVLQFIKKINHEIVIDWVVENKFKDLLIDHPDINQIHILNLQKAKKKKSINQAFQELKKLRKIEEYDVAIDMQGLLKSALVTKFIKAKIKVGFDKKSLREPIASLFYNKKFSIEYSKNIIIRNFSLAMFAMESIIEVDDLFRKSSFLFSSNKYPHKLVENNKKNILLFIGASFDSKCYPPEKLIELMQNLDANYFTIWSNEKENLIVNKMQSSIESITILNKMNLGELISVVEKMDLVIGPDTGPTHIAWGLNIPSITLFGPTPAYRNCFISDKNKVIESDSKVNPFRIDKSDFSIKNIKVDDIVKMSEKLLGVIR